MLRSVKAIFGVLTLLTLILALTPMTAQAEVFSLRTGLFDLDIAHGTSSPVIPYRPIAGSDYTGNYYPSTYASSYYPSTYASSSYYPSTYGSSYLTPYYPNTYGSYNPSTYASSIYPTTAYTNPYVSNYRPTSTSPGDFASWYNYFSNSTTSSSYYSTTYPSLSSYGCGIACNNNYNLGCNLGCNTCGYGQSGSTCGNQTTIPYSTYLPIPTYGTGLGYTAPYTNTGCSYSTGYASCYAPQTTLPYSNYSIPSQYSQPWLAPSTGLSYGTGYNYGYPSLF